jgi:hypothetical protein
MGQTQGLIPQKKPSTSPPMHSITRITTTLQATQTVAWPHFAGSTLRGAFGRALRRAACITGQNQCTACPLRNSCAYGVVFDPAAPAQPLHPSFRDGLPRYVVQPAALGACQLHPGQTQSFDAKFSGVIKNLFRNLLDGCVPASRLVNSLWVNS